MIDDTECEGMYSKWMCLGYSVPIGCDRELLSSEAELKEFLTSMYICRP